MSSRRRYLYLMGDGLQATVIDSQVITILKRLGDRGVVFELVAYQPRPPASERLRVEARRAELSAELRGTVRLWDLPVPSPLVHPPRSAGGSGPKREAPNTHTHAARQAAFWMRDRFLEARLIHLLAPSIWRGEDVVIHARGGAMRLGARLKRWSRRVRLVADFRGDGPAEYLYKLGIADPGIADREYAALVARDHAVVRAADRIQCVSEALSRQLVARHDARPERIRVVPCVADEQRFSFDADIRGRLRAANGWTDRRVLVYSGSMLAWQQPEAALALFGDLRRRRPDTHLLLLTPHVEQARALVVAAGIEEADVTIRSARYDEVAGFLCAADVALLLRERHPLNQVASPTKFAEYALMGLPTLVSRGIGDLDIHVPRLGLGALVEDHRDVVELEAKSESLLDAPADRSARSARAATVFALGPYLEDWVRLYESV